MIAYTDYRSDGRVIREAEAAAGAGLDVDFIALRRNGDPRVEVIRGVRVIHLNQSRYRGGGLFAYMASYLQFFIRCLCKVTWQFLSRRYRVVHVNNMPDFFVFCALLPKLMGAKVVLDIHDPMPDTFASKFKNGGKGLAFKMLLWQELLSARFANRVLTVSEPLKRHVLMGHGLAEKSIDVIANFADDQVFQVRQGYALNGKLRLVFHGTILERYGLGGLLTALSKVRNRDKLAVRFIGDGDFAPQLRAMITSLGMDDFVEFDNHVYPLREIPRIIADCDLGLVPLETSSIINYALPLKLLEYISLGMPVVTVRSAAVGHYFSEDDCLFYAPGDSESLPRLLDRLADNPKVVMEYHKRALAVRGQFLWSNEKLKYVSLLHELAGGSPSKQ
jgi:glycosyltransferase involved in cell wall biosynthesis